MVNVLVTGGAGFIGGHICRRLVGKGYDVVCLDNFDPYYDPKLKRRNIEDLVGKGNFQLIEGDVRDLKLLGKICGDADYVFHEAAQAGVRASVENPMKSYEVNIEGTLNLLKISLDSGVKKVINASSSSVYGKVSYLPFDEKHPTTPISPYGISKLAAEHYCRVFSDIYGLKTVSLRYFTVYGPDIRPDLAISIFTRKALENEPLEIFGDGRKTRDFTHIDDIVDANMLLMKKGDGVFNLGYGERFSVNDLAKRIIKLTNSRSRIVHMESKKGDVEHTWADSNKAKRILGWKPKVSLDEGLARYIEWVKSM
jgi:UDP-glucose 4-epimerase